MHAPRAGHAQGPPSTLVSETSRALARLSPPDHIAHRSTAPAQTVAPPTSFDLGDGSAPVPVPAAVAPLFAPLTLTGAPKKTAFQLTNRIVYAPLTRCRFGPQGFAARGMVITGT